MEKNFASASRRKITRQSAETLAPAQAGHNEVKRGLPLNPDKYACQFEQSNYELGRLRAVNILASGQKIPTWNEGKKVPPKVVAAILLAANLVGAATVMKRMSID
jgi:hypothetical protein